MKRTLLMAEIGQDNTWGIYKPGQMDKQWFCCKLELKDEIGLGGPRHLLSRTAWAVWFQGDREAKDDSRKPEKEVSWSLLPITPHNLAGQDRWADSSPQRFLLPLRELAFPGSHLFSPRETAGITFACPPQCHLQKPGPKPSATAAQYPLALPLTEDSTCWISWKSAHSPDGRSYYPHTLWDICIWTWAQEKAYHCPRTQRIHKGKPKLHLLFLYSVEFWFKKKKSKLFCNWVNN